MSTLFPSNVVPADEDVAEHGEITLDGKTFALDQHAAEVLREVIETLAEGTPVEVLKVSDFITTQKAADIIGISRPSLVKMLDEGVIPSTKPNTHRRVRRSDVVAFIEAETARRSVAMGDFRRTRTSADDDLDGFVSTR